ncbi:MAG: hypothetical protein U0359_15045 [Byssovorax sp.]
MSIHSSLSAAITLLVLLPLSSCADSTALAPPAAPPQAQPSAPTLRAPVTQPPTAPALAASPSTASPPPPAAPPPPVAPTAPPVPPVPRSLAGDACALCQRATAIGRLQNPAIDEASGLAASALYPGVLYVHNDSGDTPRFFAIDHQGAHLGTYNVRPALALDWEDMARGPCAGGKGSCLYLGDTGDNLAVRPAAAVYRVAEPDSFGGGEHDLSAEAFPFRYPDGPRDAETLLVHPLTGVITVVSKVKAGASSIYEFPVPLSAGKVVTLVKVGEVAAPEGSPRFTGGDVHPKGEGVLLRTYDRLWFYAMKPEESVAKALSRRPCPVAVAKEPQGEAVAWEADGQGYVTASEGAGTAVSGVSCGR